VISATRTKDLALGIELPTPILLHADEVIE
jgi:hypothetical protein